jgi:ParB family transcriptional regulator, chromosome partitioning protein
MDILASPPGNAGPRLLHLALDLIDVTTGGVRRAAVDAAQDEGLRASVAQLGIIQPIAVRAHPDDPARRVLITGRRRWAAARAAGLRTIAVADHGAIEDRDALAIETAENLNRVALAPVDQWRAVQRHLDLGWTLDGAAEALGIGYALARRLAKLGSLHPDLLAAIEAKGMPRGSSELGAIANAAPEAQAQALRKHWKGGDYDVPWWEMARALTETRIPQSRAIFDTEACGLIWQEDVFAEPGSANQWTTSDQAGFLERQAAELRRQAEASKGKMIVVDLDKVGDPKLPLKWTAVWGWRIGEKLPKGATGYVALSTNGEIISRAAKPPPKPEKKAGPPQAKAQDDDAQEDQDGQGDQAEQQDEAPASPPSIKQRWSENGRIEIAARKTLALQVALRDHATPAPAEALRLLLLMLAARNVTITGAGGTRVQFDDIACVADQMGSGDRHKDHAITRLAMEAMARSLRCGPVKATYNNVASGPAAEWIGAAIDASLALGRFDDAELLATASVEALRSLAEAEGITVKPSATGKAIREAITGKLLNTIPKEAEFTAPPPEWIAPEPGENPDDCGMSAGLDVCPLCLWRKADGEDAEPCDLGLWRAELARLGLEERHISIGEDGQVQVERVPTPRPRPAATAPKADAVKPPAAFDCPWPGDAACPEDGTTRCEAQCPRHDGYAAWLGTAQGKAAKRAAEMATTALNPNKRRSRKGGPAGGSDAG